MFLIMLSSHAIAAEPIEEWVKRYDNGIWDQSSALAVDSSGNVFVTGSSATIKYDANGNELWVRSGGGSVLAVDSYGNVYVTGGATIKYDANGNELWVKRYDGGYSHNQANALTVDSSGNIYVTGYSYANCCGESDFITIKYDANGNELWLKRFSSGGSSTIDDARALTVDSLGNVYVTGYGYYAYGNWGTDYTTIKYDATGNELWVVRYDSRIGSYNFNTSGIHDSGSGLYDFAYALAVDSSGNVYVTGYSATIKYDASGNELWVKRYDGGFYNGASALAVDSLGNVYVTGYSYSSNGQDYATTIKYDTNGNELWVKRYDGGSYDGASALAVDSLGNVYVTGYSYSGTGGWDYITIKYRQSPSTPAEVINIVDTMLASGEISSTAIANAIISQLSNAQNNLQTNPISAANMLNAAINFTEAQSGKKITTESAVILIKYLTEIISGL